MVCEFQVVYIIQICYQLTSYCSQPFGVRSKESSCQSIQAGVLSSRLPVLSFSGCTQLKQVDLIRDGIWRGFGVWRGKDMSFGPGRAATQPTGCLFPSSSPLFLLSPSIRLSIHDNLVPILLQYTGRSIIHQTGQEQTRELGQFDAICPVTLRTVITESALRRRFPHDPRNKSPKTA